MAEGIYHVMDDYYIGVDSMQYTVYEQKLNTKKKEYYLDALAYHGDLALAVKSLHRIAVQERLSASEGGLKEMMDIYSSVTEKLCKALTDTFTEITVKAEKNHA